jgi:ubiquinone/menaquinone biosynthesis C-methylase UbiE
MIRKKLKKLNLGCDFDYKEGWTNLDFHKNLKCDVVHDMNKFPYPFKDGEFDYVLAKHVIEHLDNIPKVMNELWRITKSRGIIEIHVPYYKSFNAFRDVTHRQFFTWDSFSSFTSKNSSKEGRVGYIPNLFEYADRKLFWGTTQKALFRPVCTLMNSIVNANPEFVERRMPFFFEIINPEALMVKLRVRK